MKTKAQVSAFVADIKAVCEKHRIGLLGTCESEGIIGEITLVDLDDPIFATCDGLYNFYDKPITSADDTR